MCQNLKGNSGAKGLNTGCVLLKFKVLIYLQKKTNRAIIEERYEELKVGFVFLGYDVASIGNQIQIFRSSVLPDIQGSKGPRITECGPLKTKALSSFETY